MVVLQVLGVECRCKGDASQWLLESSHLSQMCSAAQEEFPHFLEGLQGAMMAASSPPWFEFEFLVSSLALCLCIAQKHLKEPSAVGC